MRLCVTITAPTMAELVKRRDAVRDADLVELRLDSVAAPDVAQALYGRRRPVIITCRPRWEGGQFAGSEEERRRLLASAIDLGADYVDVEWRAGFSDLLRAHGGKGLVVSSHDFDAYPADLDSRLEAMRATGAEVVKVAVKARRLSDCVRLRETGCRASTSGATVVIAMGLPGLASRVLPARFGSAWSYAGTLNEVGQLDAETLLDEFRFRSIDDRTEIYGIAGRPVAHSVSPAMHNAALADAGRNAVYLPLAAADVDDFATFAHAFGLAGASITVPFKVDMFERVEAVSPVARRIGSINTVRVEQGRWMGENTDAAGFLRPLDARVPLGRLRASILGAGGAARAVATALAGRAASVRVHARDRERAEAVARETGAGAGSWPPEPGSWDLLVNCTPVGMHPEIDAMPLPSAALTGRYVYDLVYNPRPTRLLREAAARGCTTIDGLDMLVAQAQEQFRLWTGIRPPEAVMRDAALRRLAEFEDHENHVV